MKGSRKPCASRRGLVCRHCVTCWGAKLALVPALGERKLFWYELILYPLYCGAPALMYVTKASDVIEKLN